jgi:hypothetical protein
MILGVEARIINEHGKEVSIFAKKYPQKVASIVSQTLTNTRGD